MSWLSWIYLCVVVLVGTQINDLEGQKSVSSIQLKELPDCRSQTLPAEVQEWQSQQESVITVEWIYGGVKTTICDTINECFHTNIFPNTDMEPQLIPLIIQSGAQLKFHPGKAGNKTFGMKPYRVSASQFHSCNPDGGQPITNGNTKDVITVRKEFLQPGQNYFIATTDSAVMTCKFGLRINVTVKDHKCRGPGEPGLCWNRGRCISDYYMENYECSCCNGFIGPTCDELDACSVDRCNNRGTCIDVPDDPTGTLFTCKCNVGWTGETCDTQLESQCLSEPCEHNGTCYGNKDSFQCACADGWEGSHCEVNVNECASNPCVSGMCEDKENGYQCFCIPGHGGKNCDIEYDECQSSPCRNNGFCIDKEDGYECHCGIGYTGRDCSLKIDLCRPSPCKNATECVDEGNSFFCTCNPGFQGHHCEININECDSNPCLNSGHCYDLTAGYKCICRSGTSGDHCEHISNPEMSKPLSTHSDLIYPRLRHRSHLHNLLIVAGTLAGALLIALTVLAVCYCRFYGTRNVLSCRQFKYKKQKDLSDPQEQQSPRDATTTCRSRPSTEAIIEASSSRAVYQENTLNAPLIHSLKPKRI